MNAFSGDKAGTDKAEAWMLQPFPREAKHQRRKLRDRTVRVLAKLLQFGKLPSRIQGVIRGFEEVSDLVTEDED